MLNQRRQDYMRQEDLRSEREKRGITQAAFAQMIGVSQGSLSLYENMNIVVGEHILDKAQEMLENFDKAQIRIKFFKEPVTNEEVAATDPPSTYHDIAWEIADIVERKNADYGDSFKKIYKEYGMVTVAIRLSDKLERIKSLLKQNPQVTEESMEDTLRDIAGYAILALKLRKEVKE